MKKEIVWNLWKDFNFYFHFTCLCGTLAVVSYCFYRYHINEDVSVIGFNTFHDTDRDLYPTTTLCFYNPFLEKELANYGHGINITTYSKYLQGYLKDERMDQIEYDNVTVSMDSYLLMVSGKMENGTLLWIFDKRKKHPPNAPAGKPLYYTSFRSGRCKCFSFDIPYMEKKLMWNLFIKIKTSIFPKQMRSHSIKFEGERADQGGFRVSFHYPWQNFRSYGTQKHQWSTLKVADQEKRNCRGSYMRFRIKGVEVLERRNKRINPCNIDWLMDYMNVTQKMVKSLQCRPPHIYTNSNEIREFPVCSTPKDIQHILKPTIDELQLYPKPCRLIEKLIYDYDEGYALAPEFHTPAYCKKYDNAWFNTKIYFGETTYKEIRQVRAINLEGLAGNISGYIGFFLGYSLLQLPSLILFISNILQGLLTPNRTQEVGLMKVRKEIL